MNWWHRDTTPGRLHELDAHLVEVFCTCHTTLVAARFRARKRHPGHLDQDLTADVSALAEELRMLLSENYSERLSH